MDPVVTQINFLLALGTLALQFFTLVLVGVIVYEWRTKKTTPVGALCSRFMLPVIFLITFSASVMTLVYSEIFGFIPCSLCWIQRIFLYPIVFISGAAVFLKDRFFAPTYILILSILGAIVSLYQHYLQMGGSELVACPATVVSCSQRFLFEFGYITFPLLAFSLFTFVIVLVLAERMHMKTLSRQSA